MRIRAAEPRHSRTLFEIFRAAFVSFLLLGALVFSTPAMALQNATPWSPERSFQNLVYGSSSFNDVITAIGRPPDDIIRSQSMFPLITNFLYYDDDKSGAATVFVFENGMLLGMHYRTPNNQMIDMTYCLQTQGDRVLNYPYLAGYQGYYTNFPMFTMTEW